MKFALGWSMSFARIRLRTSSRRASSGASMRRIRAARTSMRIAVASSRESASSASVST